MVRVAVINDYHRAFTATDAIRRLRELADLTIYEEPFPLQDAMVEALRGVEIVIANRERTRFTAELLARLPDLRLISNNGPWVNMTVENVLAYLSGSPVRVHNPEPNAQLKRKNAD